MGFIIKYYVFVLVLVFINCFNFGSNLNIVLRKHIQNDVRNEHSFENNFISNDERIKLCKSYYPDYDYNSLDSEEKNAIRNPMNPCRVDCVIQKDIRRTYSVYFMDRKTVCGLQKVCCPARGVGGCVAVDAPSTTQTITETPEITTESQNITIYTPEMTTESQNITIYTPEMTTESQNITIYTPEMTTESQNITIYTPEMTTESQNITIYTPNPTMNITTDISTNTTITVHPKKCSNEGFFRDPTDPECRRFYECIHYKRTDYLPGCPNGTIFDETIHSCQYPWESAQKCAEFH